MTNEFRIRLGFQKLFAVRWFQKAYCKNNLPWVQSASFQTWFLQAYSSTAVDKISTDTQRRRFLVNS